LLILARVDLEPLSSRCYPTSHFAGIAGMSHCIQPFLLFVENLWVTDIICAITLASSMFSIPKLHSLVSHHKRLKVLVSLLLGGVGASSGKLAYVSWHLTLWESSKNWGKSLRTRLCLCDLVSGLVRKPDVHKNNIQGSQMASCLSDVNKKVMLTVCFSCFCDPILKET
jgi:hypothetical protein